MAIYLGFSLLLFVIYERTFHIEACYETMRCDGNDVELDFKHNRANSPIYTEWFFTSTKNVTTQIAKKQYNDPMFHPLYKARAFIEHNKLYLGGISTEDSGIYTRKVTDDSNDSYNTQEYTDEVKMTVMLPPSSKPILRQKVTKNSTLMLICEPPTFLGYPAVKVVMKDSEGNTQGALSYTINDTVYQCCLYGEATNCLPGNAIKTFRCVIYESTINKLEEIKSDSAKDCDLTKSCLTCISISWLITFFAIKVATGLKFGFRVIIAIIASFCGDQKSCIFPNGVFILFGMGSALLLLIPELASIKLNTDPGQWNRRGEINNLNNDHL